MTISTATLAVLITVLASTQRVFANQATLERVVKPLRPTAPMGLVFHSARMHAIIAENALCPIAVFLFAFATRDLVGFHANLALVKIIATEMEFVSMNLAFAIRVFIEMIVLYSTLSRHSYLKIVLLIVLVTVVAWILHASVTMDGMVIFATAQHRS
jgi:hypothetical protein